MARRPHPKRLLVEGRQEQRVIPELVEANNVPWGNSESDWIVRIEEFDGVENLLKPGVIEATFKSTGVETVGVIVDADGDIQKRWSDVRACSISQFPDIPEQWPGRPLIASNSGGVKFGVWIMPDNRTSGMLETFLQYLAPSGSEKLLEYAKETCVQAQELDATFKPQHRTKAEIYTWLAWQDEPGRQLHQAVKERILNPASPSAADFVTWFRELFDV